MTASPIQAKGLEGIIVADTHLSRVEGDVGRLTYCGYNINDLARQASFEEVAYLLWNLRLPTAAELAAFQQDFSARMALPPDLLTQMKSYPRTAHPMAVLRTAVSACGLYDPLAEDNSPEANRQKALTLAARMPSIIAAWARIREGQEPIAPRADLKIAENFLYMVTGKDADPTAAEAIDRYLILLADHEMNASTFTARAVTSTTSDMYSAITAAIGSLKGPAHGGAIEASMRMFLEIRDSGLSVEEWFQQVRAGSRRIMGIGHRIYKTEDPRARILREVTRTLADQTGHSRIYEIAYQLEIIARADPYFIERNLYPNVDYYSGLMLYVVGIPVDMLTTMFAMSRVVGWTAHVMEQWKDNRLMRPKANYVGEMGLEWVPIERRG